MADVDAKTVADRSIGGHLKLQHERDTGRGDSPATLALVLSGLFFAGAFSGALTLLLPHSASANDTALWSNVAVAMAAGATLAGARNHLRPWMAQLAVALGTLAITRAIYFSGEAGSFYSLWYVWVGLYAFFFFGRRWGLAHMALVGLSYGWVLTQLPYSSSVVRWLMTVATLAIAGTLIDVLIGRLRQREAAAQSRARSLEIVSQTAHELARHTTSTTAAEAVCGAAASAAGAADATVWEPAADGRALAATASTDASVKGSMAYFLGPPSGLLDAFTAGEQRFHRDAGGDGEDDGPRGGSALFQPIVLDGVPIAVLAIRWDERIGELADELDQVISLLALEAALALDRAANLVRLERVARTDELTGLANRRAWDEHMLREVARAARTGGALAVGLLDLDHFKDYNDVHGHPAGDRLLKEVGARWSRAIRATDILARYGGEEFALALPGVEPEEARSTLERMRTEMPGDQRVSGGLVFWDGEEDAVALLDRADRALYAAKSAGRDRVLLA